MSSRNGLSQEVTQIYSDQAKNTTNSHSKKFQEMTNQGFQISNWQTRPKTQILDVNKYTEIEDFLTGNKF